MVASPVQADWFETGLVLSSGADLGTTVVALDRGLVEQNPFAPESIEAMVAFKVVGTAAVIGIYRVLKPRHPGLAKALAIIGIVAWSFAAGWNVYQIREQT